ncbi:MAG TPA: hypothetical protein VNQ77_14315 [Frankiaceae bacterium]|nr:hypothetical protein [Frankiaceae bacterium]
MKLRTFARAGVAAVATAALTVAATPAQAYEAPRIAEIGEVVVVCDQFITIENIQIPGYANCMLDYTGNYIAYLGDWAAGTLQRVGDCIFFYDPLFSPIPSRVVPETVELANCVA